MNETPETGVGEGRAMPESRLEDVIRHLINLHNYLHEKRIQKLVFLADLRSIQSRGRRLVEADFKRYYHGVFSEQVALTLGSMQDLKTEPEMTLDNTVTVRYCRPDFPYQTPSLGEDDKRILNEIVAVYRKTTNEELADIGKSTRLWESVEFGQVFDYNSYLADPATPFSKGMGEAYERAVQQQQTGKLKTAPSVEELMADQR
jgi:uncharacterized phage-associated protein